MTEPSATTKRIAREKLDKMEAASPLLPPPGNEVVKALVEDYRELLDEAEALEACLDRTVQGLRKECGQSFGHPRFPDGVVPTCSVEVWLEGAEAGETSPGVPPQVKPGNKQRPPWAGIIAWVLVTILVAVLVIRDLL